jgi:hypothetical protein
MRQAPSGDDEFPLYVSEWGKVGHKEDLIDTLFLERLAVGEWKAVVPAAKIREPWLSIACVCKLLSIQGPVETGPWSGLYTYQPLSEESDERNSEELVGQYPLYAKVSRGEPEKKGPYLAHGFDSTHQGMWVIGNHLPRHAVGKKDESYMWIKSGASIPDHINNPQVEHPHQMWMVSKTEGRDFVPLSDTETSRPFRISCSIIQEQGATKEGIKELEKNVQAESKKNEDEEWKAVNFEARDKVLRAQEQANNFDIEAQEKMLNASETVIRLDKADLRGKVSARKMDPLYMFALIALIGGFLVLSFCVYRLYVYMSGPGPGRPNLDPPCGRYQRAAGGSPRAFEIHEPQISPVTGASPRRRSSARVDMELI